MQASILLLALTLLVPQTVHSQAQAQGKWTSRASMQTAVSGVMSGVINGKLYVAGGHDGSSYIDSLQVYDPSTNSWSYKRQMGIARGGGVAGVINGKLYVFGGENNSPTILATLQEYDPSTDTWSTKTAAPGARLGTAAEVLNDTLYVVGGYDGSTFHSTLLAYDPISDSWSTKAAMPSGRSNHATWVYNNKLYVAGGQIGHNAGNMVTSFHVYDPSTNVWTALQSLTSRRNEAATGVLSDRLYMAGGHDGTSCVDSLYYYDPAADTWSLSLPLPTARNSAAVGVFGDSLFVAGGYGTSGQTPVVEVYTPIPEITLYQPTGVQQGTVTVQALISDPDSSYVDLLVEYSTSDGISWLTAAVTSDTTDLAPAEYNNPITWASASDLANQEVENVWFRVTPRDSAGTGVADTTHIAIDNQALQSISAEGTAGDTTFTFWFNEPASIETATDTSNISLSNGLKDESIQAVEEWSDRTPMPTARHSMANAVLGGKMYVVGGLDGAFSATLQIYDPLSDSWSTNAAIPTARYGASAVAIDGKLYVVGGEGDGGATGTLEIYSHKTDSWTTGTSMPTARRNAAGAVVNGKLFVIGGKTTGSPLYVNVVEMYDPATDAWTTRTPLSTGRSLKVAGVIDGLIYVAGGHESTGQTDKLEVYDPASDQWVSKSPMLVVHRWPASGVIDGKLYLAGGIDPGDDYLDTVQEYDPASDTWTLKQAMPIARGFAPGGVIDGLLYIAGGSSSTTEFLTTLQAYDPSNRFKVTLSNGRALLSGPVTITASNISDYVGNIIPGTLDTTFTVPSPPSLPSIAAYQPTGTQSDEVTIPYMVSDADSSLVGLLVEFSQNSGTSWSPASVTGDTSNIASTEYSGTVVWSSKNNLDGLEITNVWLRITPHDDGGWGTADTTYIDIDNLAPQGISADGERGDTTLTVWFDEPVSKESATDTSNYSLSGSLTEEDIYPVESWADSAGMPTSRNSAATGVIDGKLFVVGGNDGTGYSSALEVFDPSSNSWSVLSPMPTARNNASAVVIDRKVYVVGGLVSGGLTSVLEVYDPDTDTWDTSQAPMPTVRRSTGATAIDGKMYVIGGRISTGEIYTNKLEVYDPATDSWETKEPMPTSRGGTPAVGVIDGKLYVVGGSKGTGQTNIAVLEAYDPETDSWTSLTSMPTGRSWPTGGVIDGIFYAMGGNSGGTIIDAVEAYDPSSDTWITLEPMPVGRTFAPGSVIDGSLYIAGGYNADSDYLTELKVYNPLSSFVIKLDSGQTLPRTAVTVVASNISDQIGNIAEPLITSFGNTPPTVELMTLDGTRSYNVTIQYTLNDAEGDTLSFTPLFSYFDSGTWSDWSLMTVEGDTAGILSDDYSGSIIWNSFTDLSYSVIDQVRVQLIPSDTEVGTTTTSGIFKLANYPGDFDHDMDIDILDFGLFVSAWNNQDVSYDIGPATTESEYPTNVTPDGDGVIDFEDLAVFALMWNALWDTGDLMIYDNVQTAFVRNTERISSQSSQSHKVSINSVQPQNLWESHATFRIDATDVNGLSTAHIELNYDPDYLDYQDLTAGAFIGTFGENDFSQILLKRIDEQSGVIELLIGRIYPEQPTVSGSGEIVSVTFNVIDNYSHDINIRYNLHGKDQEVITAGSFGVSLETIRAPITFELLQNYPNPFNGETLIRFQLPTSEQVNIIIYNSRGQRVRTLLDKEMDPGYHRVAWDGLTDGGQHASSGVYIYLVQAGPYRQSKKMTYIR